MEITDDEFRPLREGTTATVRQVGLSGVANRFVELTPGRPTSRALRDGATLDTDRTRPIVDLDAGAQRARPRRRGPDLQTLVRAERGLAGRAAKQANAGAALPQPRAEPDGRADAGAELATTSPCASSSRAPRPCRRRVAAAQRRPRGRGDEHRGRAARDRLRARRAGGRRWRALRGVIAPLDPDASAPAAHAGRGPPGAARRPAGRRSRWRACCGRCRPAARHSTPVVRELRQILPDLRRTLVEMPALATELVPLDRGHEDVGRGLPADPRGAAALHARPRGRPVQRVRRRDQRLLRRQRPLRAHRRAVRRRVGLGAGLAHPAPPAGSLLGVRTGLTARCPGAAVEPAPDGSNPWVADPNLCDPEHNR